jgi:fibronectin type 3 domain-containing protein
MWFDKVRKWARKNIKVIMAVDAVMLIAATAFFIGVDEPANAENLTVANTTYNTTELTWNSAEDAKLYRIYRSEDGSDYEYIASTDADAFWTAVDEAVGEGRETDG